MATVIGTAAIPAFLSALDYAREGIDQGVQSYEQVAQAVAGAVPHPSAISARNEVAAAAKVFEASDQLLGTILDLKA